MEREIERENALRASHGYRELDKEMSGLVPRTTSLGVTDAIVSELFSSARSQLRDFVPRDEPVSKEYGGALNYVRGETDKGGAERASPYSPAVRGHYKPEDEHVRPQPRLISPSTFENHSYPLSQPQYNVQVTPTDFALHSTIAHEDVIFDYDFSKAICFHEGNAAFHNYLSSTSQDGFLKMFIEMCKVARELTSHHCTCQMYTSANMGMYFDESLRLDNIHRALKFRSLYIALKPIYKEFCRHSYV